MTGPPSLSVRVQTPDRMRFSVAEEARAGQREHELSPPHPVERLGDLVGRPVVDIADEAKGDVKILAVDPSRPGDAAAQKREAHGRALRDFEGSEQSRHGEFPESN